jgi:putative toxin-antitoxin system antitoxin component (TIGR02293 family)
MSVKHIMPRSPRRKASPGRGKTDWRRLECLTDADIKAAVAKDPDTFIPDKAWWKRAKVVPPKSKAAAARLAEAWSLARQVWGSNEEARDFLFRAHPLLEGRRPIDFILGSELDAQQVDEILGRLQHGTAA